MGELIIPDAVVQEIVVRGKGKPGAEEVQQGAWIKRGSVKDRSVLEQLSGKLNLGEREALALAKEIGAALLVDEREARTEALRLGIYHFGSLKIIKEAKDHGIIPEAKPVLDELIASGTYLSDILYKEFLLFFPSRPKGAPFEATQKLSKKLGLTGSSIKSVDDLVDLAVGRFDLALEAGFLLWVVRG